VKRFRFWVTVLPLLAGCDDCTSRQTDGRDLDGVFAGTNTPTATAVPATASPSASAPGEARPPERERERIAGPCVAPAGGPAELAHRVGKRPACRRARVLEHEDDSDTRVPRYACIFEPSNLSKTKPIPLLIFLHGEYDDPTAVHRKTRLRRRDHEIDLTGDPSHPGFITLAPQARRIGASLRWDVDHVSRDNRDVVAIRKFVDVLVAEGIVDRRQIYVVGESRGAVMANLYTYLYPEEVVAFGGVAAAPSFVWTCDQAAPPAAMLYRACDADVPCADVERWLLSREKMRAPTMSLRLGSASKEEPSCALSERACGPKKGKANHQRWPKRRESELLEYLSRFSFRGTP